VHTTQIENKLTKKFQVTHPFHPLFSKEFEILQHIQTSLSNIIIFCDDNSRRRAIPAPWTDVQAVDPFVIISAGRSYFRVEDLICLSDLINDLKP